MNTLRLRTTLAIVLAAVAAATLAACGGGSSKTTTGTTATTGTATTSTTTPKKVGAGRPLSEKVVIAKPHIPAALSADAKPGDVAVFRTLLPGSKKGKPVTATLTLTVGPSGKLALTAAASGQKATATVTSASGKKLTLVEPHFSCVLPPGQTFCPSRKAALHGNHLTVQFTARPITPILLAATVGPVPGAGKAPSPGTLTVPAYKVKQLVLARSPSATGTSTPTKPATTVAAKPGDTVIMRTRLIGANNGAPQPLTISFDQGPAKSLTVTASVKGGTPSTAKITGAKGSIALVTPTYTCFLPPTPTFCPPTKVTASGHHYSVTVKASPLTSVSIEAVAQAG